jgi:predicted CXXCH cytochrome family protein
MRGRLLLLAGLGWAAAAALLSCRGETSKRPSDPGGTALATWNGFYKQQPNRIPSEFATNPGTPWGDYLGSKACETCHEKEYAGWRDSFHSKTLYGAVPQTVFGDFARKEAFDDPTVSRLGVRKNWFRIWVSERKDETTGKTRFFMQIRLSDDLRVHADWRRLANTYGGGLPEYPEGEFEVIYAFGNRRHQPYVARWPDGKYWILPIFWNDADKEWRYCGFRPYVESCAHCHTTGIRSAPTPWRPGQSPLPMTEPLRFNLAPAEEGWAEGGVGCETCHGPGRAHVAAVEAVGNDVYRARLASGEQKPTIFDGKQDAEGESRSCGRCHDFFTESTVTYVPGPDGYERPPMTHMVRFADERGFRAPEGVGQFYADGSHRSPCSTGAIYRGTKMAHEGIRCTQCHDPHGNASWAELRLPIEHNELCLSCHEKQFPTLEAQTRHSHHGADSPGNRCVECHMPREGVFTNGVDDMSDLLPKHEFSIPTGIRKPALPLPPPRPGEGPFPDPPPPPPPSCNVCHRDQTDLWTREKIESWRAADAKRDASGEKTPPPDEKRPP